MKKLYKKVVLRDKNIWGEIGGTIHSTKRLDYPGYMTANVNNNTEETVKDWKRPAVTHSPSTTTRHLQWIHK